METKSGENHVLDRKLIKIIEICLKNKLNIKDALDKGYFKKIINQYKFNIKFDCHLNNNQIGAYCDSTIYLKQDLNIIDQLLCFFHEFRHHMQSFCCKEIKYFEIIKLSCETGIYSMNDYRYHLQLAELDANIYAYKVLLNLLTKINKNYCFEEYNILKRRYLEYSCFLRKNCISICKELDRTINKAFNLFIIDKEQFKVMKKKIDLFKISDYL